MTPYITTAEAETFFENILNAAAWEDAEPADQEKALKEATIRIDVLGFKGKKTSDSQENEFPRNGDSEIPTPVKQACALIALSLLDGVDCEEEIRNLTTVAQGYSTVRTTYDRSFVPEYLSAGIPNATAWMLLRQYMIDPRNILLVRGA